MTANYLPAPVPTIALAVRQGMDPSSPERKMGQTTRIAAVRRALEDQGQEAKKP